MPEQQERVVLNPPSEPANPLKVKVKVKYYADAGEYTINSSHPVGSVEHIEQHLPTIKMVSRCKTVREYYGGSLTSIMKRIGNAISTEIWAAAIASEIINRLSQPATGEVEMQAIASGAYFAMDKAIYRLTPVQCLPTNKALSSMRRRIKEQCEAEKAAIIRVAQEQAAAINAQAATRLAEATRIRTEARQEGQAPKLLPWVFNNHVPARYYGAPYIWCYGFVRSFPIHWFEYKWHLVVGTMRTKRWRAIPQPMPYQCPLWLKVDNSEGAYNVRNCMVDSNFMPMPHVRHDASCMDIADAPPRINSLDALNAYANSLVRCMQTIELNSLFVQAQNWPKVMQDALPLTIKASVLARDWATLVSENTRADDQVDIHDVQETAETWTAR